MPSTPYIDGDNKRVLRQVKGDGDAAPHVTVVAIEDDFVINNAIAIQQKVLEVSSGLTTPYTIETKFYKFAYVRIDNTGTAFTDFFLDISMRSGSGLWETIADSNYYYTTGTGEAEGNMGKLIRKVSPINPRTLASNASTWMILNLLNVPAIRFRITGLSTATINYTLSA